MAPRQTLQQQIDAIKAIGDTRACPECGRPQHYTGTEHGWAHDALIDTWVCADPKHVSLLGTDGA